MFIGLEESRELLNNPAIEDEFGMVKTYEDLKELSLKYAKLIPRRSLVLILADYHIETVSFHYCMTMNHVVQILLDRSLDKEWIRRLVEIYEPQYIWGEEKTLEELGYQGEQAFTCGGYLCSKLDYAPYAMDEKLAVLLTTSGSTGSPKMVRISYENIRYAAQALGEAVDLKTDDKMITVTPLHHAYGLTLIHTHWLKGASVLVTERGLFDSEFWSVFKNQQVTNLSGVPFVFDMLRQIKFLEKDYPDFRFMTQAGGKLSEENQKLFGRVLHEKERRLYLFLGLTEATGVVTLLPDELCEVKIGSIGFPAQGTECILDDMGELWIHGPGITLGYAQKKEDLSLEDSNQGRFETGDIAEFDEDGCIFLKGRKKRFIKILGHRVSLDEVELLLCDAFREMEVACQGEDNQLRVYVAGSGDEDAVKSYCSQYIKIPKNMIQVDKLSKIPRAASGKIMYQQLT